MYAPQIEDEQWRPVKGYEGAYEVSDQGRVRSLDRVVAAPHGRSHKLKGKMLKLYFDKKRGKHVVLCKAKVQTKTPVNDLIVEAFL